MLLSKLTSSAQRNTTIPCQSPFCQELIFTYPRFYICSVSIRGIITLCIYHLWLVQSRDSAVGIATGYGLDDRGVGVRVQEGQEFSLLHVVQTGSGVHPTSYPMGNVGSFLGGRAAGA
jgi:hypothetical protein